MSNFDILRGVVVLTLMAFAVHFIAGAQTATPFPPPTAPMMSTDVPPAFPTEMLTVTNAAGYREHTMPDIGTVEYPLSFYSVWSGLPGGTSRDSEIFFPGVVTLRPNDSVIYDGQFDTAYQIRIAMSAAPGPLDDGLLGTGPLMQYGADLFEPGDVLRLSLNGVPALRLDHLPVGPSGEVTSHIMAVVDDRLIEIVVEPVATVGGTAVDGLEIVMQIIGSISLESYQ